MFISYNKYHSTKVSERISLLNTVDTTSHYEKHIKITNNLIDLLYHHEWCGYRCLCIDFCKTDTYMKIRRTLTTIIAQLLLQSSLQNVAFDYHH